LAPFSGKVMSVYPFILANVGDLSRQLIFSVEAMFLGPAVALNQAFHRDKLGGDEDARWQRA
jgi:hypothetical protein